MNALGGSPQRAKGSPHVVCQQRRESTRLPWPPQTSQPVTRGERRAPPHVPTAQPPPAVHRHACSCWQFNTSQPASQPLIAAPSMQPASIHVRVIADNYCMQEPPTLSASRLLTDTYSHITSASEWFTSTQIPHFLRAWSCRCYPERLNVPGSPPVASLGEQALSPPGFARTHCLGPCSEAIVLLTA
jgi:hypothetical protein